MQRSNKQKRQAEDKEDKKKRPKEEKKKKGQRKRKQTNTISIGRYKKQKSFMGEEFEMNLGDEQNFSY